MELITILNCCHRFRGSIYQHACFSAGKKIIEVAVWVVVYVARIVRVLFMCIDRAVNNS